MDLNSVAKKEYVEREIKKFSGRLKWILENGFVINKYDEIVDNPSILENDEIRLNFLLTPMVTKKVNVHD
ncbi:MAG: hypothetical protein WC365_10060 [Candidatus Babeliales bacterium]|jgi:hypothetical protein